VKYRCASSLLPLLLGRCGPVTLEEMKAPVLWMSVSPASSVGARDLLITLAEGGDDCPELSSEARTHLLVRSGLGSKRRVAPRGGGGNRTHCRRLPARAATPPQRRVVAALHQHIPWNRGLLDDAAPFIQPWQSGRPLQVGNPWVEGSRDSGTWLRRSAGGDEEQERAVGAEVHGHVLIITRHRVLRPTSTRAPGCASRSSSLRLETVPEKRGVASADGAAVLPLRAGFQARTGATTECGV
jgi:hypothetical protein